MKVESYQELPDGSARIEVVMNIDEKHVCAEVGLFWLLAVAAKKQCPEMDLNEYV